VENNDSIDLTYQSALKESSKGNFELAISKLRKCIDKDPQTSDAHLLLARIYLQTSQLDNALDTYNQAKNIKTIELDAIAGIAKIHRLKGNTEYAYKFLQQELETHSANTQAALSFSEISIEFGLYTDAINLIEDLMHKKQNIPTEEKKNLLHTLGKLYDKENNYSEAFKHHKLANELTPSQYMPAQFQRLTDKIRSTYNSDFINHCNHSTIKNNSPIFIVGMPRSGTTLLEQILSCHSEIHAAGETSTIQQLVASICRGQFPGQMQNIDTQSLNKCAQYYIDEVCSKKHTFTTDKMPHNYLYIGVICQLFPDIKIININRNPIDNCLSIYFQYFNDSHRYATNLSDISHHYAGYLKLMDYWQQQLPKNIISVNYEDIVNNTQDEITKILKFLNLEWQDNCLQHHKNRRHVLTASQQQVNKPIYNQSIERWKHYEPYISNLLSDLKSYNLI